MSDVIIYNDGELELDVSVDDETVWLNRSQISNLLDRDVKTIGKHITNVFKENELIKNAVVSNFATTAKDGKMYDQTGMAIEDFNHPINLMIACSATILQSEFEDVLKSI